MLLVCCVYKLIIYIHDFLNNFCLKKEINKKKEKKKEIDMLCEMFVIRKTFKDG